MNAASGEPLPRTLVQINGGAGEAVLTDGDGRFDISGVPLGPNMFQLTRPGFEDAAGADKSEVLRDLRGFAHDVFVTANTPALTFSMRPTNSIRGHIELSTGDVASNIGVVLLARQIQNGRAAWRPVSSTRTNADGNFHFAHLDDGDYVLKAGPAPEAEMTGGQSAPGRGHDVPWNGYPEIYYPDARGFSSAAHLHLAGGEQAEANLNMALEPYHAVTAMVAVPPELRNSPQWNVEVTEIVGPDATQVPYGYEFDSNTGKLWMRLPDGTYTLGVTAMLPDRPTGPRGTVKPHSVYGQADFTIVGHPVTKRIASRGHGQQPAPGHGHALGARRQRRRWPWQSRRSLRGDQRGRSPQRWHAERLCAGLRSRRDRHHRRRLRASTGCTPSSRTRLCAQTPSPRAAPISGANPS